MKKIPDFTTFINENIRDKEDFSEVINVMLGLSNEEILRFRDELKLSINEGFINEAYTSEFFTKIKAKFRRWFTDRLFNFLINRKKEYYEKLIDKLNIFDLFTIRDVYKAFPAFQLKSIYLAGGMDAAKKGGKVGWRNIVEHELEINHPGNKKNSPEVEIYLGPEGNEVITIKPSYCIDGPMLDLFIKNPKKCLKLYNYPALLNPVRKEVDRNKIDFDKHITALKNGNSSQDVIEDAITFFREVVSKRIAYEDELIINKSDAIFLGLNPIAGAGTYAELQMLSFIEKPLFCTLIEGYEGIVGNFKLWNVPQLCKLARNEEEMIILVDTLHQAAN
jgi:hypothetical protein